MNLYDHYVHFDKHTVDCTIAQLQSKGYDVGLTFVITVVYLQQVHVDKKNVINLCHSLEI